MIGAFLCVDALPARVAMDHVPVNRHRGRRTKDLSIKKINQRKWTQSGPDLLVVAIRLRWWKFTGDLTTKLVAVGIQQKPNGPSMRKE